MGTICQRCKVERAANEGGFLGGILGLFCHKCLWEMFKLKVKQ